MTAVEPERGTGVIDGEGPRWDGRSTSSDSLETGVDTARREVGAWGGEGGLGHSLYKDQIPLSEKQLHSSQGRTYVVLGHEQKLDRVADSRVHARNNKEMRRRSQAMMMNTHLSGV